MQEGVAPGRHLPDSAAWTSLQLCLLRVDGGGGAVCMQTCLSVLLTSSILSPFLSAEDRDFGILPIEDGSWVSCQH